MTLAAGAKDSTLPFSSTACNIDAVSPFDEVKSGSSAVLRPLFLAQRA